MKPMTVNLTKMYPRVTSTVLNGAWHCIRAIFWPLFANGRVLQDVSNTFRRRLLVVYITAITGLVVVPVLIVATAVASLCEFPQDCKYLVADVAETARYEYRQLRAVVRHSW